MLEVLGQFSMIVLEFLLIILVFCLSAFFIIPAVIRDPQARSNMIFRNLTVLGYIVSGMILAASLLISVWPEFPPIFPVEYKIIDYVLFSVGILLITGNIMYFFKREYNEEDNPKDTKAVTLCLSGKSTNKCLYFLRILQKEPNNCEKYSDCSDCFRNSVISVKERSV